ncbi:hypothetical protein IP87_07600 [beta proteobacterium AAP121]|nr:hypothetical protein IP80_16190 [beta proteobacterium AAP65]KPF98594.1 hypothetical protein IP87_07600 [beta proteobacterium AAP121]
MSGRAWRALLVGVLIATVLGWSSLLGSWHGLTVLAVTALCVLAVGGLWWLLQRTGDARAALREKLSGGDDGQHHEFDGVTLRVEDDGRHVWLDGPGLQRVLRRREPEEALAARHAGAWRRNERGVLMLRVDAVIAYLGAMPGRDEPRLQKLRRYLERDLLYPAQRRRERA